MKKETRSGSAGVTEEDKGGSGRDGRTNTMMKNGARQSEREIRDTKHAYEPIPYQ